MDEEKKLSTHWVILMVALFFDVLALIPFICIVFNAIFTAILYLYFNGRPGSNQHSVLTKIIIPAAINSLVDLFIGVLPVNTYTTYRRIKAR